MLRPRVLFALDRHIDNTIKELPNMKARFASEIEMAREVGFDDDIKRRRLILQFVLQEIKHKSILIFMQNSQSVRPTEADRQLMIEYIERRSDEIESGLNSLKWE